MKLLNGPGRIRIVAMMGAAAVAIAASVFVASPAQAAEPDHCVVALSADSDQPVGTAKCFETYEAARDYVASVAEVGSPKDQLSGIQRSAASVAAAALVPIPTLLYIGYDWANRNPLGGSLWVIGWDGGCTGPTNDIDYTLSSLSSRWDNDISSATLFSNCYADHWDWVNWGGAHTGYQGSRDFLTNGLDNDTSSLLFS